MGGGDLNLKKSWHPSTLRNIERVWKAEQKHEVEQQKIEQLQKELADERAKEEMQAYAEDQGVVKKKEQRLDWMYQGPAAMVNREDYLLGKKIDKTFESLQQYESGEPPKDKERDIGSTMFSSQDLSGTATVDLATKIREDPLFNIMKKEKEERKNLLTNPVKMKQLQQMLEASIGGKKSKKSKKSKKKKHRQSDSEEEVLEKKHKKRHEKLSSDSDGEQKLKHFRKHKTDESSDRKRKGEEERRMTSDERRHKKHRPSDEEEDGRRSSHHKSAGSRENGYSREFQPREPRRAREYETPPRSSRGGRHESQYPDRRQKDGKRTETKRALDSSERERLLQEMQENAKWRDEQRRRNTQRYREEEEREERNTRLDTADFVKPMLAKAAGKGSLENRVKQKIFTIQRSNASMDKNFARRD